jgi:AAA domain
MTAAYYPEGFHDWPLDRRNEFIAAEARAYDEKVKNRAALRLVTEPPSSAPPPDKYVGPDSADDVDRVGALANDGQGQGEAEGAASPVKFTPRPFKWRDPKKFPRRQFAYGKHYIRKFFGLTVAPTKTGKSSLGLVEAVAMASGKNLLGVKPERAMRVWYWNGEDPIEELERRVLAICLHYSIDPALVEKNLFLDSGRDCEIILATQTKSGTMLAAPVEDALIEALLDGEFDVLILDPAISIHRVSENDNGAVEAVVATLNRVADKTNVAIEAVHHTRKLGGQEATTEDSRGASAWVSKARDVRVLNRMTKQEAAKVGVELGKERLYFRSETDGNLTPSSVAEWFHLNSIGLGNGSRGIHDDQDYVGVVIPWKWPDAFEGVTVSDLRKAQAEIRVGVWRENSQAKDWAGIAIARVVNLDPKDKVHRAKIIAMLKKWTDEGMFVVVEHKTKRARRASLSRSGKRPTTEI